MSSSREDTSQGTNKDRVKDRQMETFKDAKERMEATTGGGGDSGKNKHRETTTANYTCFCPYCECKNSVLSAYKQCDACKAKGGSRGHAQ